MGGSDRNASGERVPRARQIGGRGASGSGRTSHVLEAIGLSQKKAKASIRLGWGRYTTMDEIETAAAKINAAAKEQGV